MFRIIFLVLLFNYGFGQNNFKSNSEKRCEQYRIIMNDLKSDSSTLSDFKLKEINFKADYYHFIYRHSYFGRSNTFNAFIKRYKKNFSFNMKQNTKDSLKYTNEFKNNSCLISPINNNVTIVFDRFDNNLVFVITRLITGGDSYGQTVIYYFDDKQKFTKSYIGGFIE